MDLNYTDEDRQFRQRARDWLQDNVPANARPADDEKAASYDMEWQRRLFDGGFAGINWPKAHGGLGLTGVQQIIWFEEAMSANAPHPGAMSIALNHAGPTLIVRGSEDQQAQHLPTILRGETVWCQGFSEPGAGSDLAALRTRARLDGDHFVVDGQKMWTSNAHHARFQELLVRTDPDSKRHRGLTWLICDMNTPGIEIKPIKNMMGERHVNALFYDNVRIPVTNVVGEVGQGWSVAMSTLSFERGTYFVPEQISLLQKVEEVAGLARRVRLETGKLAIEDDSIVLRLAEIKAKTLALRALTLSTVGSLAGKAQPGPEGSVVKLYLTTTYQELSRLAAEIISWNFLDYGEDRKSNRWTYEFMWSWVLTIAGGSSEIQREIIADKILELPRAR